MNIAKPPHSILHQATRLLAVAGSSLAFAADTAQQEQANSAACPTAAKQESLAVGGQAVMEGVMMRNGALLALAVRRPDHVIVAGTRPWFTFAKADWMQRPYLRGFPILIETMVNGIKTLNLSAELAMEAEGESVSTWQITLTLLVAIVFAIGLFVVLPHGITLAMASLGLSGNVEGFSFHFWDGIFKFGIFIGYIVLISRMPDIARVFQYHGAEHKSIWAYEKGENPIDVAAAMKQSCLHPRCGTAFMLFVLSISILMHMIFLPPVVALFNLQGVSKHVIVLFLKILLMIPISCLAYELIRNTAHLTHTWWGRLLQAPGLLLQRLTTREPDENQLAVALISLRIAVIEQTDRQIIVPDYTPLEI